MKLTYVIEVDDEVAERINKSGERHDLTVRDYFSTVIEAALERDSSSARLV